jgi:short-subunit dehydrogenase
MTERQRTSGRTQRRALITGASAGIGEAFARRLARDGYDLIVVARRRVRLEELAAALQNNHGVHARVVEADLTQAAALHRLEQHVADTNLDLLVNNAGFGTIGRFAELDVHKEEEEIRLNVLALVRLTRSALPAMIKRGKGGIINVSSMAGFQPCPYTATYGATKAYVTSFTEALAEELRGTGVIVQALCPGFTRTEFQERGGIDASGVPSFAWMSAEEVVDASLAALARGRIICVPGLGNQMLSAVSGAVPRAAVRRIVGAFMRRAAG